MLVNNNLVSVYYEKKILKKQDENENKFQNNLEQENQKSYETSEQTQFSESSNSLKSGNIYRTQVESSKTISKFEKSVGLVEALGRDSRDSELFSINNEMMNTLLKGADTKLAGAVKGAVEGMREKGMSEVEVTLQIDIMQLTLSIEFAKISNIDVTDVDLNNIGFRDIKNNNILSFLKEHSEDYEKYNGGKFNILNEIKDNYISATLRS